MEQFIKPMEDLIKLFQNIYEIAWNSSSNRCNSSLEPSKKVDENGKQSSLEEDSVKIIDTRQQISFHVSPIVQKYSNSKYKLFQ